MKVGKWNTRTVMKTTETPSKFLSKNHDRQNHHDKQNPNPKTNCFCEKKFQNYLLYKLIFFSELVITDARTLNAF